MLCIWFPWAPRVLTLTEVKRRRALHCTLLLDISLGLSIGERKEGDGTRKKEKGTKQTIRPCCKTGVCCEKVTFQTYARLLTQNVPTC